jgi:hypothetical protein
MTTNNRDSNKFIASESETWAHVRVSPKPIVRVRNRSNSKPKAAEADHLILESLARLNRSVVILEEALSEFLRHQKYSTIRERERRW